MPAKRGERNWVVARAAPAQPHKGIRLIVNKLSQVIHYDIEQLAEGVYAAIARPEGMAFSNAAIVDLGGETLVMDTGEYMESGAELRQAAEGLFGRPVANLAISHHHGDHWKGTAAFGAETRVLGSQATLETMQAAAKELEGLQVDPGELEAELAAKKERLSGEEDPRWRMGLERSIRGREHELATLADFEVRLPDEVFEGGLTLEGTKRRAELVQVGRAHSRDDSYLVLPDDGITFLADLGFFGELPVMRDCNLEAWRAQIDAILAGRADSLVPGHGPVGGKAELAALRDYFSEMEGKVRAALGAGGKEAARAVEPGAPFAAWLVGGMGRLEENIEVMIREVG